MSKRKIIGLSICSFVVLGQLSVNSVASDTTTLSPNQLISQDKISESVDRPDESNTESRESPLDSSQTDELLIRQAPLDETQVLPTNSEEQVSEVENRVSEDEEQVSEAENRVSEDEEQVSEDEEQVSEDEEQVSEVKNRVSEDEEQVSESKEIKETSSDSLKGGITQEERDKISYEVSDDGLTMTVQLKRQPECLSLQYVVTPVLLEEYPKVKTLVIEGAFSKNDEATGSAHQLSLTNVETIILKNSNFVPHQFYFATPNNPNKLTTLKLDESVTSMHDDSMVWTGRSQPNNLMAVEASGVVGIDRGSFDGFKGTELVLKNLESANYADGDYNDFYDYPNAERLLLPKLKVINGFHLFANMPKIQQIDLSSLTEFQVSRGNALFDNEKLAQAMTLRLDSLLTLPEVKVGNLRAAFPMYVTANQALTIHNKTKLNNAFFYSGVTPQEAYTLQKNEEVRVSAFGTEQFVQFDPAKFQIKWYLDDELWQTTETADIKVASQELTTGEHVLQPVIAFSQTANQNYEEDREHVPLKPITLTCVDEEPVVVTQKVKTSLGELLVPKNFIKEVKVGNQVLEPSKFEVVIEEEKLPKKLVRDNRLMYVTEPTKDITVPLKVSYNNSESGKTYEVVSEAPLEVDYGTTLGMQTIAPAVGFNKTDMGSLALIQEKNQLRLTPVYGEKNATTYPYAINDANHVATEAYVGLYKPVKGIVDVRTIREREGEIPQDNGCLQSYSGGTTLAEMLATSSSQFDELAVDSGDIVMESVHKYGKQVNWETKKAVTDKILYGDMPYLGGDGLKFSRFNMDLFEVSEHKKQPTYHHLALNHFENPHGPKPLKDSKEQGPVSISKMSDLEDEKLLAYLGKNRDVETFDGYATLSDETMASIDFNKGGEQTIPVSVFEKLASGNYASYEYDLQLNIKKPITVNYVYTDEDKTRLPKNETGLISVEKTYTIQDSETGELTITPKNLEDQRFLFKGSFKGETLLSSKLEELKLPFTDDKQVIYLKYQGESWLATIENDFLFRGKLMAEEQLLKNQGVHPVRVTVKSTDLAPQWRLSAKVDEFKETVTQQPIEKNKLTLQIDKTAVTATGTVVHQTPSDNHQKETVLVFGPTADTKDDIVKSVAVLASKNSERWIKPDRQYQAVITWELKPLSEEVNESRLALPLKEGGKDGE